MNKNFIIIPHGDEGYEKIYTELLIPIGLHL